MLIIQNILLKWFDEWQKSTKAQQMQEWSAEQGCRGSGAWGHWDPKLTQSDNGRRQPVCQVCITIRSSSLPEFTFLSNSGQNAVVGHFRGEKVNHRQPRLVLWVGEGWGYQKEETRR